MLQGSKENNKNNGHLNDNQKFTCVLPALLFFVH